MKYYVINFENGVMKHGYFGCYLEAFDYAESMCHEFDGGCCGFTIETYHDEDDYFNNI